MSRDIEHNEFFKKGLIKKQYTGNKVYVKDKATGLVCQGTVRCLGNTNRLFDWQINLLHVHANLLMNTDQLIKIEEGNGSESKPYYEIFIGRVFFQDKPPPRAFL